MTRRKEMTNEDKRIVADYMGWKMSEWMMIDGSAHVVNPHFFDINDAGLVVQEMQKRGDWEHDFMDFVAGSQKWNYHQCIAWLFNADNFFKTFVEWRKAA